MLHSEQLNRQEIWRDSLNTLPTFLAYAEAMLDLAYRLPSFSRGQRFASRSGSWRFAIPSIGRITLHALPLTDEQL